MFVFISLSIYFSIYLSIYVYLSIYLSIYSGLRVLLSYLKVAIFEPQLRKWTFVLKSCDFGAAAAKVDFAYYFRT